MTPTAQRPWGAVRGVHEDAGKWGKIVIWCTGCTGMCRKTGKNCTLMYGNTSGWCRWASSWAKPPHFAHGPAAATLLRGGNNFSGRCRKNQFPRSALPSSPLVPSPFALPSSPNAPPSPFPTTLAPLPISSVNCKTLKYNLLRKRGVSVFDTPHLLNPLKISTLHFTPLGPS